MRYDVANRCSRCRPSSSSYRWPRIRSFSHKSIYRDKGGAETPTEENAVNPSVGDIGRLIENDFAAFKEKYQTPKYPIVLAHGLMGFDELHLLGRLLPGIQYWRGIKEALTTNGIEVITTHVQATGSIQDRAKQLLHEIQAKAAGKKVNIVAHSMGGLDSRYLISRLKPAGLEIASLTTIATPHRGSSAADIVLREIGPDYLPGMYRLLARLKIDSGAFSQLTRKYLEEEFNPATPDDPSVRYFSYGASFTPPLGSFFRLSHDLVEVIEGPNDGLVSVSSSKWGQNGYRGTLVNVSHLDLINWYVHGTTSRPVCAVCFTDCSERVGLTDSNGFFQTS